MRILALLFVFVLARPCLGQQVAEPGLTGEYTGAQNPGAVQDAEAARERLLKAADQIDMIESNFETAKLAMDGMKTEVAQLQTDNATLKQEVAALQEQTSALQAALDRARADQGKEREALINEVATLLATKNVGAARALGHHHKDSDAESPPSTEVNLSEAPPAPKRVDEEADHVPAGSGDDHSLAPPPDTPPPHPEKGYYHVVESGETLTLICNAYRAQGVKVNVAEVMRANGLTSHSMLKVGQKLFIPKSGT